MNPVDHNTPSDRLDTPRSALRHVLTDTFEGFLLVTHRGMAVLGLSLAAIALTLTVRVELRSDLEHALLNWLLVRQDTLAEMADDQPTKNDAASAGVPDSLPRQQANVTKWLSRKYRVAAEPLGTLVAEAYAVGEQTRIDPTLILAVMASESRFNPYAQSPVGAQGLMQVLTRVHTDKYQHFGGQSAAFDPLANLRVGAQVLRDCIQRGGSVEEGLRLYVGAVQTDGTDYINKVMAEQLRLQSVALGKPMPTTFPVYVARASMPPVDEAAAMPQPPQPQENVEPTMAPQAPQNESQSQPPADDTALSSS